MQTTPAGIAGQIISVALILAGSASFAGELIGFATADGDLAGVFGRFSDADIAALERAANAETSALRIAELGEAAVRPRQTGKSEPVPTEDLFPYTGKVLPLLVPRPDAIVRAPAILRPGMTRPVGVPYSVLRSPTAVERTAR
ncbi:MAG: hypothetical protein ACKOZU_00340 [Planctomycetaceae bacterium]